MVTLYVLVNHVQMSQTSQGGEGGKEKLKPIEPNSETRQPNSFGQCDSLGCKLGWLMYCCFPIDFAVIPRHNPSDSMLVSANPATSKHDTTAHASPYIQILKTEI